MEKIQLYGCLAATSNVTWIQMIDINHATLLIKIPKFLFTTHKTWKRFQVYGHLVASANVTG